MVIWMDGDKLFNILLTVLWLVLMVMPFYMYMQGVVTYEFACLEVFTLIGLTIVMIKFYVMGISDKKNS